MTIYFFLRMFKISLRFQKWEKKLWKCFWFLRWYQFNSERQILTLRNSILVIASPCVNNHPYDFQLQSGRCFPNHFTSEWWKNMIKVLSWRLHKRLGTLNLLTLEEYSDNAIFSEWSNQVLDSRSFWKYITYDFLQGKIIEVFVNTHGLPITSILFRFLRICPAQFKWNYLRN